MPHIALATLALWVGLTRPGEFYERFGRQQF
jgi:hypothetical protein